MRGLSWSMCAVWTALAGLVLGGCPNGGGNGDACHSGLLAGDLVITEIMANPQGTDEGGEWFEIYNPRAEAIDLSGVKVEASRADGTGETIHVIGGATIAPGQYFVLGGMLPEVKPTWVDYTYVGDLGSLRNAGGRLTLYCNQAIIDRVVYMDAADGKSLVYDGSHTPDAIANDNVDAWCESELEFEPDAFGTPGTANEACESDLPPTSCKDGETVRDVIAPLPGDLVITEFMANPDAVDDNAGEWFEVYVNGNFDLNGLKMGKTPEAADDQVASLACVPVSAGTFLIFGVNGDSALNGGLPRVDWVFNFGTYDLTNSNSGIYLKYGEQDLDGITYTTTPTGASLALEPTLTDPVENDNADYWCHGTEIYGAGDRGTPGAANTSCGISPAGQCYDNGALRALNKPNPGDLVVTEVMPNPAAVDDAVGEWFEVYVGANVDLNGLQLGKAFPDALFTVPGGDCLPATAGTYLVFANNSNSAENGGLPAGAHFFDFGASDLVNSSGGLFVAYEGALLDAITWSTSTSGAARALDPDFMNATANDEAANWCSATVPYGAGDAGSPGAANPQCP